MIEVGSDESRRPERGVADKSSHPISHPFMDPFMDIHHMAKKMGHHKEIVDTH
jgi:hypothetical protein